MLAMIPNRQKAKKGRKGEREGKEVVRKEGEKEGRRVLGRGSNEERKEGRKEGMQLALVTLITSLLHLDQGVHQLSTYPPTSFSVCLTHLLFVQVLVSHPCPVV